MDGFFRHIDACNNLASPAGLIPFRILGEQVGWLQPELARWLAFRPQHFHFDAAGAALSTRLRGLGARDSALADAVRGLARAGFLTERDEPFDVRAGIEGPVLARLDRGAIPAFGVMAQGVHLNGLVRRPDGLRRDVLHVFDLELPEDVVPVPHDDEVEHFELWPARRVLELVRDTDSVKFNVNLVLTDLFLREGLLDADSLEGRKLAEALRG